MAIAEIPRTIIYQVVAPHLANKITLVGGSLFKKVNPETT